MKKAMLVLLAAVLVTAGVGLATCSVDGFEGLSAAAPDVPVGDPGTGTDLGTVEIPGEVSFPAGSVEGTVSFAVPFEAAQGSGAAQSVSGAGLADIKSVGRGVRNIYQLIAVDDSVPDAVSGFDEIRTSGALSADIVKGHTYHFLVLGGHVEKADPVGPGNQPTLLVSGYVSKTMSTEAGSSRFSLTMTPLVVDAAFVKNGASGEVRQSGRLAKTVGLDEKTGYTFRVVLGSDEAGVLGPDDALRTATGNGITPLVQAEAGVKGGAGYWGDLSLLSNAAQFNDEALADYNDANRTDLSKPHTTRGTAEYMLTTPPTGAATTASFKMEYAPFGLADAAWADSGSAKPVWVIRNGLNGNPQDANTDFAAYNGITDTGKNPNGALNVAVVNPTAARGAGLYEGNNPAPVEGVDTSGEGGLVNALDALNDKGDAAKYGDYTVRLDTAPDDLAPITLGGGDYADIKDIDLVIEGPTDAPIKLPPESGLFPPVPDSGVTVEYGDGVTTVDPFTVTYKTNNGSEDVHHTDTVAFPATSVGSLPSDPAWAGHDFTGWKDGGGAEFTDQTTVSADIEVYAQW
ncbi:MAG: InlB B-repeat-containing protein, partial [Spirochaetaceae bacterium]|nr:InlB B-repeat-containing protein [Spirochaetaceae bacterium]